jgi:ferrous iron transport protein A
VEAKDILRHQQNESQDELIPLTMVTPGKDVTLISIDGGKGIKNRLYSMGLTPGITLRVLNNGTPGPFLVAVRDCKVALGYGVAKKVIVR